MAFKGSENYDYTEHIFPHGIINGVSVPFFATPELREQLKSGFKPRPSDIFIITYPKSGTTWLQNIMREICFEKDEDEKWGGLALTDRFPYIDFLGKTSVEELETMPDPRVFKCHNSTPEELDVLLFKGNRNVKIIYVVRDPLDVCVSLYHHLMKSGISEWLSNASFSEYFNTLYRDPKTVFYGLWEDHVTSWLTKRDEFDILLVKYEDLQEDSRREITRIVRFLGREETDEAIARIADKTSFKNCKAKELFVSHDAKEESFLRKGVVGDWLNYFNEKDAEVMKKIKDDVYEELGL